jgi:hypothetical protein
MEQGASRAAQPITVAPSRVVLLAISGMQHQRPAPRGVSEENGEITASVPCRGAKSTDLNCPSTSQTAGNQHDWGERLHFDDSCSVVVE